MVSIKERNSSIDLFRYFCAILIIAIHTAPFSEINAKLRFLAVDVIPRISVPFFFIVSGYFYIRKLQNGEKPFNRYLKHLVTIYFVWSCLYYFIDYLQWGHADYKGYIINCITTFVYYGSSYHFWFFPALIISLCVTTLLWNFDGKCIIIPLSIILYAVGVLGCAYYNLIQNVPVFGRVVAHPQFDNIRRILLMGFPFFGGGYAVLKIQERIRRRQGFLMCLLSVMVWVVEIVIIIRMQYQKNIVITFGLYPLVLSVFIVLLQNPLPKFRKIAGISRKLANFTYYTHPAFILLVRMIFGDDLNNTSMFILITAITFVVGLFIDRIDNPIFIKMID